MQGNNSPSLSPGKQLKLSLFLLWLHIGELRPIDMVFPTALAQIVAMVLFLPSHNFIALAISSLCISAAAMFPGLPHTKSKKFKLYM
jgi:uncharacterized membrane protein YcaP (DUF421 family)